MAATDHQTDHTAIDRAELAQKLAAVTEGESQLYHAIVNAPFDYKVETTFMFLGIIVLLLVNKETGMIDRVALSNTELAKNTTDVSVVPFHEIKIPVDHKDNIISRAIQSGDPQDTTDWKFLFTPALKPDEARINQASAGISYSAVYPFQARDGGALIFSYFQYGQSIGEGHEKFMTDYAELVGKRLSQVA